jgi:hypothetical protein
MPFKKNDKNINREGRKTGSLNKSTQEIRAKYLELIQNNFEQLDRDIKGMRGVERVRALTEMSKFILPTLKATEMSLSNETKFQAIEIELK